MKSYNRKIKEKILEEHSINPILHWRSSRKGHKKARWIKMNNRIIDYLFH